MERNKLLIYLMPGIGLICFLAAALFLFQTTSRIPATGVASTTFPVDTPTSTDPALAAFPTQAPARRDLPTNTAPASAPTNVPASRISPTDTAPAAPATTAPTRTIAPTEAAPAAVAINVPLTQYPTIPASASAFTVPIHSTDPSGVAGTATFKDIAGTVAILLHLDGPPGDDESIMPVEIRFGTCAALGDLAYPMSVPDAGESETDLSIDLKQFNAQKPMAVVLYRSLQDRTVIACGDIL